MIQRVISTIAYLASCGLAAFIIVNAGAATEDYGALYEHFSPSNKANTQLKTVLEALSLGLYKGGTEKTNEIEQIIRSAQDHERRAYMGSWLLLVLSAVFLAVKAAAFKKRHGQIISRNLVAHVLGIALVFLVVGLLAPILSLVAYTEVAVLGKVVFKYESKGVITSVLELIESGNVFIAIILFTFSVVTPVLKQVLSFLAIKSSHREVRQKYVRFLSAIGKWSMADVLVVAVLLSFFISGSEDFSDSWLGTGLYFFAGYCLLSLLAVQFITHVKSEAG